MKKTSNIVINGRRYDAHTGKPMSHVSSDGAPGATEHKPAVPGKADVYRPTRHIAPHKPEPAHTLMRKAVKRPPSSVKRRIKVQGRLEFDGGYERSKIITHRPVRTSHPHPQHSRRHTAKGSQGQIISHFSPHLFTAVDFVAAEPPAQNNKPPVTATSAVRSKPPTTDEILEYAALHADVPQAEHHAPKRRHKIIRRHAHAPAH